MDIIARKVQKIFKLIATSRASPSVRKLAFALLEKVPERNYLSEISSIFYWVRDKVRYTHDPYKTDVFEDAEWTLKTLAGDCFTLDTDIVVRSKITGFYDVLPLGALEVNFYQYEALSYNFTEGKFEFKDILGWFRRGIKDVYLVKTDNGFEFKCTLNHRFFRLYMKPYSMKEVTLGEIKEEIDWENNKGRSTNTTRRVACAYKIPSLDVSIDSPDELWLAGIYAAEGGYDPLGYDKMFIANDDPVLREEIRERLDRIGVPYSESKRLKHSYITIRASSFRDRLKELGGTSLSKTIPPRILSATVEGLEAFVDAFAKGDAYIPRRFDRTRVLIHNTSSLDFVKRLKLIYLILGRALSYYYQENHMGAGSHPIWRLNEPRRGMVRKKREWFPGIEVRTIKSITHVGQEETCDIFVADNHNFVLWNGVIAHNCDAHSVLLGSLLEAIGYPVRLKVVSYDGIRYSHIYPLVGDRPWNPTKWIPLDATIPWAKPGYERPYIKARVFEAKEQ